MLAGADDTVAVLTAARPLAAGERLTSADVTSVRLRFDADADADRYLAGDGDEVTGSVLSRPVGQGELVPRAALGGTTESLVELPLGVDPGRVPAAVRTGSVVDVWVTPPAGQEGSAELLLERVPVLAASRGAGAVSGTRQVVVGVRPEEELTGIVSRLGEEASVLVVARGGEGG